MNTFILTVAQTDEYNPQLNNYMSELHETMPKKSLSHSLITSNTIAILKNTTITTASEKIHGIYDKNLTSPFRRDSLFDSNSPHPFSLASCPERMFSAQCKSIQPKCCQMSRTTHHRLNQKYNCITVNVIVLQQH